MSEFCVFIFDEFEGLKEVQARFRDNMIEAVNSVVANASVLRASAEALSTARSFTANPERVQEVVQAPYVSPYISMDINHNKAVLQIRNRDTGDVLKQFPSETALEFRSRQAAVEASRPVEAPQTQSAEVSVPKFDVPKIDTPAPQASAPQAPQVNAQAQVAAAALASTQAQAAAVSAPPSTGNVVVTA